MISIRNFNADKYDEYRRKSLSLIYDNENAGRADSGKPHEDEQEIFTEYAAAVFGDDLKLFIEQPRDAKEYKHFIDSIFGEILGRRQDDPVWKLLEYLDTESDFFSCPASTKFHSNEEYGLIRHSLLVFANGLKLAPIMLCGEVDMYYLALACLFHDFCKVNMYEIKLRNVKNEETGAWEKTPYYKVKDSYISHGHGIESMLRLNKYIAMPDSWNQAVRWHMGAYDLSPLDKKEIEKALNSFREVLFLQTADMLAGLVEAV
jgi:hypothetical protein